MGGRKSPFPITLAIGLYNSVYYRTSRDYEAASEIRQPDAEWHDKYSDIVEIETGSRIPVWRTFVIPNQK